MTVVGFHASHEQIHPSALLEAVVAAEQVGFTAASCSDHFLPWSARQGHSGFAWAWLGAALQATSLRMGVVNAPGQRYHPAIIAQAAATLAAMFPNRFWVALGSGEYLNEHITGEAWPRKDVRNARLRECVDVMRALLTGEEVSHDGLVTLDRARLWTLPEPDQQPPLVAAAVSARTARWAAQWADGLMTVNQPPDVLREVVAAYRDGGGRGPLHLQVHVSYAASEEEALAIANDQWRVNCFPPPVPWDLATPELFDTVSAHLPPDAVRESVLVSSDPLWHAERLDELVGIGFDEVYLHHVGREQREFIDTFGAHVLPQLGATAPAATR
jgi:probable non-F420 flavinoid oxidoreductase